jgi:hypothetical protein
VVIIGMTRQRESVWNLVKPMGHTLDFRKELSHTIWGKAGCLLAHFLSSKNIGDLVIKLLAHAQSNAAAFDRLKGPMKPR